MSIDPRGASAAAEPDRSLLRAVRAWPGWARTIDVSVAVALAGYGALAALTSDEYPHPGPATAALVGAAGLALVVRRVRPTLCLLLALSLLAVPSVLFGSYQSGSSLLIALVACYSAAAYGTSTWVLAAAVVGFAVVDGRGDLPGAVGAMVFVVVALGAAAAGGVVVRRMRSLTAANIALRELVELEAAATTRAAVDEERARVARELHDILSHSLGVVVLQTTAADHAWVADPERARDAVRAASSTALEAVEQLRTLLSVVRDGPDGGRTPVPTLDDLGSLAAASSSGGFRVDLVVEGTPRPVPAAVQASVYRVAQEGIANALRHSGASGCRIRIGYEPAVVTVQVDDDGSGSVATTGSQLGLAGIRERARLFGARVQAGPREPGGWRLRVEFPG